MTDKTAIVLRPSISGRYLISFSPLAACRQNSNVSAPWGISRIAAVCYAFEITRRKFPDGSQLPNWREDVSADNGVADFGMKNVILGADNIESALNHNRA